MSPLFQLVLFNFLFRWPPLFGRTFYSTTELVLFNFLFRWPPLFGRTFYSTTGFIQQLFYSTAYSLYLIPTVLFNSCSPDGRPFNFLFRWPPLFGRTFYLNGCPYLVTLILSLLLSFYLFYLFFFFLKRCLTWIRTRDLLISSLDAYR